jgi:hypothetical protein
MSGKTRWFDRLISRFAGLYILFCLPYNRALAEAQPAQLAGPA